MYMYRQIYSFQSSENTMDAKLIPLIAFAVIINVANCQSTFISNGNGVSCECELSADVKSEMESIRQLLMIIQQKKESEIEDLRQQNRNDFQNMQDMKSEIEQILQIAIQQQYWSRNQHGKTGCPFEFDYLPEAGSCFKFVFEGMSWGNATELCRAIVPGVHLAVITTQEENDAVVTYLQSQFRKNGIGPPQLPYENEYSHGVWIAGQRRNPGLCDNPIVWKPLNGIEIPFNFTNWASGEPNCYPDQQGEPCVHFVPGINHTWNDDICSKLYYPLCEI